MGDHASNLQAVAALESEPHVAKDLEAAADHIKRLEAETEKLRAALEKIKRRSSEHPDDTDADRKRDLFHVNRIATRALSDQKENG